MHIWSRPVPLLLRYGQIPCSQSTSEVRCRRKRHGCHHRPEHRRSREREDGCPQHRGSAAYGEHSRKPEETYAPAGRTRVLSWATKVPAGDCRYGADAQIRLARGVAVTNADAGTISGENTEAAAGFFGLYGATAMTIRSTRSGTTRRSTLRRIRRNGNPRSECGDSSPA